MRIIAFIQDAHAIRDIMKAEGIDDLRAPRPISTFIDISHAIDELPSYDSFEPSPVTEDEACGKSPFPTWPNLALFNMIMPNQAIRRAQLDLQMCSINILQSAQLLC